MEPHRSLVLGLFLLISAVAAEGLQPTTQDWNNSGPHLTGCFSRELVTFHCRWDVGSFHNLTEPGDLRLFYKTDCSSSKNRFSEWQECPTYSSAVENECYFNKSHTCVWYSYVIQLRSRTDEVYGQKTFSVEEIVFPDPPEALNWTLVSLGPTGLLCDVLVSWMVPTSAAESVETGWMKLLYETQYREKGSDQWKSLDSREVTEAYVYGLNTNTDYEVRVRSRMRGYNFGEFIDPIVIFVSSQGPRNTVVAVLTLTVAAIGIILMLIVVSRQQKLMVILLPPVPGPKIKGIDPALLKKGKITEFTSVLDAHPGLHPECYTNDPWVEFIEVDMDEPIETLDGFDAPLLFSNSCVSDSPPTSSCFQDDDSGRASCCDPDLSDHDHHDAPSPSTNSHDGFHTLSPAHSGIVVSPAQDPAWPAGLYSQVAEVMPGGQPLLSPEQAVSEDSKSQAIRNKEKMKKPVLVVIPDERGYTSDLDVNKISASFMETLNEPNTKQESDSSAEQVPSGVSAFPVLSIPMSPPEYTMVDVVDWNNSLVLRNPSTFPVSVVKSGSTPEGYLTPDLLSKIAPK
ncbi:growth hormone receptor b [Trichomycterus rosablanca]|uniref:growth hormone receptor b n=1 Tax=Trichomycterus rosablanca TaxID=2290929 RepID=UPI002F359126